MLRRSLLAALVMVPLMIGLAVAKDAAKPAKKEKPVAAKNPIVEVTTSLGSFQVELWPDKAPKTVENFLQYVDAKFYDGTIFHRVIAGFMIQGGGFDEKMNKKETRAPIANEAKTGGPNKTGTIAMARTSDPNSATAQFFVNTVDNAALDYKDDSQRGIGYAVFGKVIKGMDVVQKIEKVSTGSQGGMGDVPTTPVVIKSIRKL
jgi:cyclophilin family peptidyl-prolyl cis-trans isomerase